MTELNDDNLELDVTRMLDGELSDTERDELARRLLRDPAAHRLKDATAAIDALAGGALREALGGNHNARPGGGVVDLTRPRRRYWMLGAVAAAAASLIFGAACLVCFGLPGTGESTPVSKAGPVVNGVEGARAVAEPIPAGAEELIWQVWDAQAKIRSAGAADESVPLPPVPGPRDVFRQVDRQLYRVYDDQSQTVYLLGVDRVRTSVRALGEDL